MFESNVMDMPHGLPDMTLHLKLFYINSSNTADTLREFRHMKRMRKEKCLLTQCALRKMIAKIGETGSFSVKRGRVGK